MIRFTLQPVAASLLALALFSPAHAKLSAADLARLGKDLTPVGAEKAGNKDGSIPSWEGGLTKAPDGFNAAEGWANPFKADKPLLTITAANAEQHKARLTPGQLALLKRYPSYKMVVYPSRRTAASPASVYEAVKKEAATADTANDGNSVVNVTTSTVPFPVPQSGVEAIWNHIFRYRGMNITRTVSEFPVKPDGSFTPVKRAEDIIFPIGMTPAVPNTLFLYRTRFTAPSSIAGDMVLAVDAIDQFKTPRAAWIYNPGTRRVLRAPEISYDSPRQGLDGLSTIDDYDGYNGSPDRYDWKLMGKREMYIAYNNYALTDKKLKYADIVKPGVLNQDLVRYELHRVWVVEATLKSGKNHVYGKRVYFLDEDSWQIAHGDLYDGRGELWRVLEQYGIQYYNAPAFWVAGSSQYDLQSRRYVSSGLANEEKPMQFTPNLTPEAFTASALRRAGN